VGIVLKGRGFKPRRCRGTRIWASAPEGDAPPFAKKCREKRTIRDPETSGDFITLARVVKTQGRRGEVASEILSDVPGRFAVGMKLLALPKESSRWRDLKVEDLWPHKGLLVLKFAGVDSISDAEALVGCELQVPSIQRSELEPGWNYVSDLVGCTVFDHNREIGRIEDIKFGAGEAPLLIVWDGARRVEIPFAEAYLESADVKAKQLRMKLPEGLLEVNAPITEEEKQEQAKPERKKKR
jgi:16S rRNA processing protein RimM